MTEVADTDVARWAAVLGPSSAAARALTEFKRRSLAGEDVRLFRATSNSLIVGPPLLPGPRP